MQNWKLNRPLRITLLYIAIGAGWILLSDRLLLIAFPNIEVFSVLQTYKGWFFIVITSIFIFILLLSNEKAKNDTDNKALEQYRRLVEQLPAVVFLDRHTLPGASLYMSPRLKDLLGYDPDEWATTKKIWETSLHPDDKERVLNEDKRTNQTGDGFHIEYRLRHRDGHYVWIKEDSTMIHSQDGSPMFWQGTLLDITQQKMMEQTLQRRDDVVKAVGFAAQNFLESSNWEDNIYEVLEHLGIAIEASRVYILQRRWDVTVSRIHEWNNVKDIVPHTNASQVQDIHLDKAGLSRWAEYFDKGLPIIGNIREFPPEEQKSLEPQVLSTICIPIQIGGTWWGIIGIDEFKTDRVWTEVEIEALRAAASALGASIRRKSYEDELKASETSYRGLFDMVRDGILILDADGLLLDINDGAAQMHGYTREDLIERAFDFLSAPQYNNLANVTQAIQDAFKGSHREIEFWGLRKSGDPFPEDMRLFKGSYFGRDVVICVAHDITARKASEDTLKKQLKELKLLHAVALVESTAKDMDTLIAEVTNIISDMLHADNGGILLLNQAKDLLLFHPSYRGIEHRRLEKGIPVGQGIAGNVVTTQRSIRVGDVSTEVSYFEQIKTTRSKICVPIASGTQVFGVLNFESDQLNAFTEIDETLLNTVAGGLGNAIERILLFEAETARRKQAEILRDATLQLASHIEPEALYTGIFDSLQKLIHFDSASIELEESGHFHIVAGRNIPKELIGIKYMVDVNRWGSIDILHQPIIMSDVDSDKRFKKFEQTKHIRSWMGVPLIVQNKVLGFLNLDSTTRNYFNTEMGDVIQIFANQAAIALENMRLFEHEKRGREDAENLSLATSSLTNTLNTNELFENIFDWLQKLAPYDSASIMMNIGNFLKLVAARNLPDAFQVGQEFPFAEKWKHLSSAHKALIIKDAQEDEVFEKWEGSDYIHGWMAAAMFTQDSLIGFINLDSNTPGAFTEEHAAMVQTFANQAATAIENSRLFELEKKRRLTSETVRQATTALTNLLDLPSLQNAILEWIYKITPYDSASILEIENDHVRITASRGLLSPKKAVNQTFSLQNTLCQIMNKTGEALIIEDCHTDPRFEKWGDSDRIRGWMGVPLISRGQVIGYITLDSLTPNVFTQNDAISAQTFAQQAATSLENVRLYTETKQRLEELELVSRVSYSLRAARDTNEMMPILLNEIMTSIGSDSAGIWMYDSDENLLTPSAVHGKLINLPIPKIKPGAGMTGKVFTTGKSHISPDIADDPLFLPQNAKFMGKGWGSIAVPIRSTSEVIGIIQVVIPAPKQVESHYVRLITTIAEIAGNAILRSKLYERSEEQIRRLTALREMDTAITSSHDLELILHLIIEHFVTKMSVSAAAVLVLNPNSQMLDYRAANGFQTFEMPHSSISIGDEFAARLLLERKPLFIKDTKSASNIRTDGPLSSGGFASYYAIPLVSKGTAKGILEIYFREPFSPNFDWLDFAQTLAGQATIAIDNSLLFESIQRSNQELSIAYDTTLEGWGKALELRDKETRGHTQRVTDMTLELAREMNIPSADLIHIRRGTLLHDIGKMGVSDNILHKPGPLTDKEMAEMRKHPQYARDLLVSIPYLREALDIPYCHHEWWDGSGYPRGLREEEIPLSARIFAVVDVWDALLSDRPYRKAWDKEKVIEYIVGLSGRQFDPNVVQSFLRMVRAESSVPNSFHEHAR